jgi:non-ribosomal peptide synthase protein (TIGR01720 family)
LTDAVSNWRLQPQELMLTAIAATIGEWLGRTDIRLDMESHGRELISSEVDLLRTVGWFTSLHPVSLSFENSSSDADRLRAVKAQLRNIPNGGIAYGALRYLSASPEIRSILDEPTSPLLFNYLGQWRRQTTPQSWLTFEKPVITSCGSSGPRQYVFEINVAVFDGELQVAWTYGSKYHHRPTVEALAEQFLERLTELTEFCASASDDGLTPQDFPDAELSSAELDDILTEFGES